MTEYNPDCWHIIKLTNKENNEHHYRVLCSWGGSYLYGSSWKISSGIEDVTETPEFYVMPQTSGSVYMLDKRCERISGYMSQIFEMYTKQSEGVLELEYIPIQEFLNAWGERKTQN